MALAVGGLQLAVGGRLRELSHPLCNKGVTPVGVLEATDGPMRAAWAVVDQLRRAALSVDVNLVEGDALGTAALFRRHARVALGSAAEAQRLLVIAARREYLPDLTVRRLLRLADRTIACLFGLLRSPRLPFR